MFGIPPRDPFEGLDTIDTTAEEDIKEMQWEITLPDVKTEEELNAMTKAEIIAYGELFGLDVLRKSFTKKRLINELGANGLIRGDS